MLAVAAGLAAQAPNVEEKSIAALSADLQTGRMSAETLVTAYLDRIAKLDRDGPALHSVIVTNPHALEQARAIDARRKQGEPLGPLAGIPILVKDNIETADGMATTAGSLALKDNVTGRDAPVIVRLKAAGAIILGKTNLSEWANIRSNYSISGWSAIGGLVKNPYALDRNACGSSSGTGAAIAASLATVGVGTETDGSVICPSSLNGLVGLKPTVGLVSRHLIVPISHTQDTPGPMARGVADAAILLDAMAGPDPNDPATLAAPRDRENYAAAAAKGSLKGARLGILRYATGISPADDAVFEAALRTLRAAGAELVEIKDFRPDPAAGEAEGLVLAVELKADLNAYLANAAPAVKTRTLADLIAFNAQDPREMALFGQDFFEEAQKTNGLNDPAYRVALAKAKKLSGPDGIDALISNYKLDALIGPSDGPAWRTDIVRGDRYGGTISSIAAQAGYPHLTVPMGAIRGLPVGLSFIGKAWSEAKLLGLGTAFERVSQARFAPTFAPSLEDGPDMRPLLAPMAGQDADPKHPH
jgi:amidase